MRETSPLCPEPYPTRTYSTLPNPTLPLPFPTLPLPEPTLPLPEPTHPQERREPRFAARVSADVLDLLHHLLCPEVEERLTAAQALQHQWVTGRPPQRGNGHGQGHGQGHGHAQAPMASASGRQGMGAGGTGRASNGSAVAASGGSISEAEDLRGVQAKLFDLAWAGKASTSLTIRDKEPLLQQGKHTPFVFLVAIGELAVYREGIDDTGAKVSRCLGSCIAGQFLGDFSLFTEGDLALPAGAQRPKRLRQSPVDFLEEDLPMASPISCVPHPLPLGGGGVSYPLPSIHYPVPTTLPLPLRLHL